MAVGLLPRFRLWAAIAAAIVMGGIVLSMTVTAIVVGLGLVGYQLIRWARVRQRGRAKIVAALLAIAVVGVLLVAIQPDLRGRFVQHSEELRALDLIELARGRHISFRVAAAQVMQNPLFGVSPGRFPSEFTETAAALRLQVPEAMTSGTYFEMVHNDYLETAAKAGIPALAGMVVIALFYLQAIMRRRGVDAEMDAAAFSRRTISKQCLTRSCTAAPDSNVATLHCRR